MKGLRFLALAVAFAVSSCGGGGNNDDAGDITGFDISYDSVGNDIIADTPTDSVVPDGTPEDAIIQTDTGPCISVESEYGFKDLCNGTVYDKTTGLTWQKGFGDSGITSNSVKGYCGNLELGGAKDWRTPSIDELRTLIVGCPATEFGGSCPVSQNCWRESCTGDPDNNPPGCKCSNFGGPVTFPGSKPEDDIQCYLDATFEHWCNQYWSYTKLQRDLQNPERLFYVTFYDGAVKSVASGQDMNSAYVKCVRGTAKIAIPCWDTFTPVPGCVAQ
jgi:hypothetical protein